MSEAGDYFPMASGDSISNETFSDFYIDNTRVYGVLQGKFSIDKKQLNLRVDWYPESDHSGHAPIYRTTHLYMQNHK